MITTKLYFHEKDVKTNVKAYQSIVLENVIKLFNNNLFEPTFLFFIKQLFLFLFWRLEDFVLIDKAKPFQEWS